MVEEENKHLIGLKEVWDENEGDSSNVVSFRRCICNTITLLEPKFTKFYHRFGLELFHVKYFR